MDDANKIIDDWLSGEEIDPTDYDAYQIEEFKRYLGQDEADEDDYGDAPHDGTGTDFDDDEYDHDE